MKKLMALFLAAAMMVSMTACGSSEPATEGGSAETEKVLFIGGTGPLTGDYATYGTSVKNGATLAMEEINAKGGTNGYTLKVVVEDDQADPQQAVQAYATLMDDGMDVSLGGTTSGACIAITEEAKKDGEAKKRELMLEAKEENQKLKNELIVAQKKVDAASVQLDDKQRTIIMQWFMYGGGVLGLGLLLGLVLPHLIPSRKRKDRWMN